MLIESSLALIYPQTITYYQVDDQVYSPAEVAAVNTFNTFLDAIDGVGRSPNTIAYSLIVLVILHVQCLR